MLRLTDAITDTTDGDLTFVDASATEIGAAMQRLVDDLLKKGEVRGPLGEKFPIPPHFMGEEAFRLDRALCAWLGLPSSAVHLNGFVRKSDGLHMWIARRAAHLRSFPNLLDNLVAGGQPVDQSVIDNLHAECGQEAGISEELAQTATPVGLVTFQAEDPSGVRAGVAFCFDLELPEDFQPVGDDGEVASFALRPIEDVVEIVRTTRDFKFNCNAVIIDFLVRHGVLTPDEPEYAKIVSGLRRPLVTG